MLYVFYGTDAQVSRAKALAIISSLRAKRPDAAFVSVDADHWAPTAVEEHLGGQGLFSNKYIVYFDRVTDNADAKESLGKSLAAMAESANVFIVFEGKVLLELKKAFEKHAAKAVCTDLKSAPAKKEFDAFAIANAYSSGNAIKSWILYRQAIDEGNKPEAIAGMLFWKIKSMMLSGGSLSVGAASVWKKASKLICLYHDAHRGMGELEYSLEKFILEA